MTAALKEVAPKMGSVSINTLTRDYKLYPRDGMDFTTVERFKNAVQAGAKFPPLRVCEKTGRIIDGFHRYAAYSELKVEMVDIIGEVVKDDADFFLRAVEANKAHGLGYKGVDHEKIVRIARLLKLDREKVAFAMAIPVQKFDDLKRTTPIAMGEPVKYGAHHQSPRNRMDSKPDPDRLRTSTPVGYFFFFNQCIKFLKSDDCDLKNNEVAYKVRELREALEAKTVPEGKQLTPLVLPDPVKQYYVEWAEREGISLVNCVVEQVILQAEIDAENSGALTDEQAKKWQKKFRPFTVLHRGEK